MDNISTKSCVKKPITPAKLSNGEKSFIPLDIKHTKHFLYFLDSKIPYMVRFMDSKIPYMVCFMVSKIPYMIRYMGSKIPYTVRFMVSNIPYMVRNMLFKLTYFGSIIEKHRSKCRKNTLKCSLKMIF